MQIPNKDFHPIEVDKWKDNQEMKRLRRNLLGVESYGWDGEELKRNERK